MLSRCQTSPATCRAFRRCSPSSIMYLFSSLLREVHSLFQNEFSMECDLVLPFSSSSILSFPCGHSVVDCVLFFEMQITNAWKILKFGDREDGKDQLDRACDKWRSITQTQRRKVYPTCNEKNWIGHLWLRNSLLKHEGKIERWVEVKGRRRRRRKLLLDGLQEKKGYWKLKTEAIDRTLWRNCFGRRYWPVLIQTAEWMNVFYHCNMEFLK